MPGRQPEHSWMALATRRRIAALDLGRTDRYGPRPIATPGLVASVPTSTPTTDQAS
jgi:hypothetical protein